MNSIDNAIVNLPLAKRGDIDAQIYAYKQKMANLESKVLLRGEMHLARAGAVRVFANRTQADKAAARTGGESYQSAQSRRFLVRFPVVAA